MMVQKNVLTIATGRLTFLNLAENLARSFYFWNKETDIQFYIATDQPDRIAADVKKWVNIIPMEEGMYGKAFSTKLHLDQLAPSGQTLFIDSDCLIFGNIRSIFTRFNGHAVAVVGDYISDGEWFGNIAQICKQFNINKLPKFNGGIYYIEKGETAALVYNKARELEKRYDEIGFVRLRGMPNDEVLMALAMELCNQTPIPDDGSIMSDPLACQGTYHLDIISGYTKMINPPSSSPLHQKWYPHHIVKPTIVHFLGYFTLHYPYLINVYRLKKLMEGKLNFFSNAFGHLYIQYPHQLKTSLKNSFRPLFRLLFGTRKIKPSNKI